MVSREGVGGAALIGIDPKTNTSSPAWVRLQNAPHSATWTWAYPTINAAGIPVAGCPGKVSSASSTMRSAMSPCALPDDELPDHTGKSCKSAELQGDDPRPHPRARTIARKQQQDLNEPVFYPKIAARTRRSSQFLPTNTHAPGGRVLVAPQPPFLFL